MPDTVAFTAEQVQLAILSHRLETIRTELDTMDAALSGAMQNAAPDEEDEYWNGLWDEAKRRIEEAPEAV
jgi:hypothetical protein